MRSSERTSSVSPHICYFSNEKSNICREHFDPYGVLPLIFFLLKISILISQPFDLYSCFFPRYRILRAVFFIPFSASSSQVYLYFQCLEEVSSLKFSVRSRCDGCCLPFHLRDLQWNPRLQWPQKRPEITFPPHWAQQGAVMHRIQHRFKWYRTFSGRQVSCFQMLFSVCLSSGNQHFFWSLQNAKPQRLLSI